MQPLIADASVVELAVPAIAAILGVLLGGAVPHFFTKRRNAEGRYDAAISAVARLQAARWGVSVTLPSAMVKDPDPVELTKIERELSVEGIRRFIAAADEARATLSALYPYSPDLRHYWDKFEIPQAELDDLVRTLMERRGQPTEEHPPT